MANWDPRTYKRFSTLLGQGKQDIYPEDVNPPSIAPLQGLMASKPSSTPETASIDTLRPNDFVNNPPPDARLLNELNRYKDQLEERKMQEQRSGDPRAIAALQGVLDTTTKNIEENPLQQAIKQRQAQDITSMAAQHQAQLAGFGSPQEQAGWGRQLETQKVQQPANIEQLKGLFGLKEQELKNQGLADVEGLKKEAFEGRTAAYQQRDLLGAESRVKAALAGAYGQAAAAAIRASVPEIGRFGEMAALGRVSVNDPAYVSAIQQSNDILTRFTSQLGQTTSPNVTAPKPSGSMHINDFIAKHPGSTARQLLSIADDPAGEIGGFETPADRAQFIQALASKGIK